MSFRLYLFYCALVGGWCGFVGWLLGRAFDPDNAIAKAGVRGLFLGAVVAVGLGLLETLAQFSWKRPGLLAARVGVALAVGAVGGAIGGIVGQGLYGATDMSLFFVLGWVLTGLLIGCALAGFDLVAGLIQGSEVSGAVFKMLKGLAGGALGGILGGVLALLLRTVLSAILSGKPPENLISPSGWGFILLGACIGLLIGLAQVVLKEAWVRVEKGFRPGRDVILTKSKTLIGRGEHCDIGLFGDAAVEKLHARIVVDAHRYFLEPCDGAPTYVNDQPIEARTPLRNGDAIRLGNCELRFGERARSSAKESRD